jgi:hypothetical protein
VTYNTVLQLGQTLQAVEKRNTIGIKQANSLIFREHKYAICPLGALGANGLLIADDWPFSSGAMPQLKRAKSPSFASNERRRAQ